MAGVRNVRWREHGARGIYKGAYELSDGERKEHEEFLKWHEKMWQMPEAENPSLYKRARQLVDRMHERRARGMMGHHVGAEVSPADCPNCTPEEICFGHGLLALVEEYRRTKDAEKCRPTCP